MVNKRDLSATSIAVKSVPDITSLIQGVSAITDLRELAIEELLGRTPVKAKTELMEKIPFLMMFVYGAFFAISGIIIIYLIVQRIKNRGKEGFEERDN